MHSQETMMMRATFIVLLLLVTSYLGRGGRSIREMNSSNISLVSDGTDHHHHQTIRSSQEYSSILKTTVTCEATYGFLPCTTTVWGKLFLLVVYEYLLKLAQQYVSSGSDLFFEMFGTGIFGAFFFQMFGMIPQVVLVLVAAFSGTTAATETMATMTETMATMGMAMVAGSVIMNLTLLWGFVVAFGSYDFSKPSTTSTNQEDDPAISSASSTKENSKPFSLTGYGVTTDRATSLTARIMLLSMVPFLILQLARVFTSSMGTRIIILISLIVTLVFLILYCTYQVFQPWIQNRRLEYLLSKYVQKHLVQHLVQSLLDTNGSPSIPRIKELFHKIDKDNNAYISAAEMRTFILGMQFEKVGRRADDFVKMVMEEFDLSGNSKIDEAEFVQGLMNLLNEVNKQSTDDDQSNSKKTSEEQQALLTKENKKSRAKGAQSTWLNYMKATFLVILGTAITFFLGQPLMQTLQEISTAINIPSLLVSYVVIPFALNYRMTLGIVRSVRQKTENAISLTFSQMYGGIFMNNVMGLASFLALVYIQDLSWDVSAEILTVLIICTGMGLYASFSIKFPFWTCIVAFLLYPISLLMIYVLTTILGWA